MKIKYCPVCGMRGSGKICDFCENNTQLYESKEDWDYYTAKAEEKGWYSFLEFRVLFEEEIVNNPLYSPEAHERAEAIYRERGKKQKFDAVKYTEEYQRMNKCPNCGSLDISKISLLNSYAHYRMFGLFSKTARSNWKCVKCGHKW